MPIIVYQNAGGNGLNAKQICTALIVMAVLLVIMLIVDKIR